MLQRTSSQDWQQEWFFPIYVDGNRFLGAVMVRETGLTALTITTEREREVMNCGPSIEYSIRDAARQLLSDNWK